MVLIPKGECGFFISFESIDGLGSGGSVDGCVVGWPGMGP